MSNSFYIIRRQLAQEMNLWGGKVDGQAPGPANFSSVDAQGSLYVVYDVTRPEPDAEWNGAYICINPGGTGNANLATIWRRISDDQGFINSTGAMTITSPLPSSSYAQTSMTYELFKSFNPEQWLLAVNYSLRTAYPQRHRLVAFEAPEDPNSMYYDWGHVASGLTIVDPNAGPTVSAVTDPGGQLNTWAPAGVYKVAYNIYNSAGETLVSPTATVTIGSGQILQIGAITVPEQAVGVNYFITADPGGTGLSQLTTGSGIIQGSTNNVQAVPGQADYSTFIVPQIQFWGPPGRLARKNPAFNTTSLDVLSLKTIKRRVNPGQFPERYVDLNPNWWREAGGTSVNIYARPSANYSLRFECIAPVRPLSGESDTNEEPLEVMISGGMWYLWNLLSMSGSSQNVTIWQAEAKIAEARFNKARNYYQMGTPRHTMRRPFIQISRWWQGSQI
jgi:hypothetical protein